MDTNQLKSLQEAEPFVPLVIVLDDKSEVSVRSRDEMYIPPVNKPYFWAAGETGGPICVSLSTVIDERKLQLAGGE